VYIVIFWNITEAGLVAEILTLAALQAGKNVLVDGSLRDSDWYQNYFKSLRNDYPSLKIGILHVTAPREAVIKRAEASCSSYECIYLKLYKISIDNNCYYLRIIFTGERNYNRKGHS